MSQELVAPPVDNGSKPPLTTEQKIDELYQFVILELKPMLMMLAENPMALMSGGMGGMPQMPPPPTRSKR